MTKVMTIVGTRPEIIRLSRTINKLDNYCDHVLVHTGQNFDYELNEIFFDQLNIRRPDFFLEAAKETPAATIGEVISSSDRILEKENPEALLILGDTNSSLSAIAAKRRKIPIFHMEAGNRCFDLRVPEEINRKVVDHLSDINLTYSQIARQYLIKEGISPDQIIVTGSPMLEVLDHYKEQIDSSTRMQDLGLNPGEYFLVSCHREENVDDKLNLIKILDILELLEKEYKYPIIFSTHPRTRKRLEEVNAKISNSIRFLEPFGFLDYINLQKNSYCVISDSGTITEESSILNFPALNLREVNERPEGFEEGSVMMVGLNKERVLQALSILCDQKRGEERQIQMVNDYQTKNVSDKVLRIIISYIDYINRRVWSKN